jgi:uncharacterized membrane protein YwaF
VVVALGFALYLVGRWLLETWEFGARGNFGWVAYAPLSHSFHLDQVRLVHPWVILLFWLLLLALWLVASLAILRSRSDER